MASDLGLDANWLNDDPADLLKYGLPEGFKERLQTKIYGQELTVHYISRVDQIHFEGLRVRGFRAGEACR